MSTPNPVIQKQLEEAKQQLAELKAEKARLFPPNEHPLAEPDKYPGDYTPEQWAYRKQLDEKIDKLEKRIDELQLQLYRK